MPLPRTPGPPASPLCLCTTLVPPHPTALLSKTRNPMPRGAPSLPPQLPGSLWEHSPIYLSGALPPTPKSIPSPVRDPALTPFPSNPPPLSIPGLPRHWLLAQRGGHRATPQSTHLCTGWHYPSRTYVTLNIHVPSSRPHAPLCSTRTHISRSPSPGRGQAQPQPLLRGSARPLGPVQPTRHHYNTLGQGSSSMGEPTLELPIKPQCNPSAQPCRDLAHARCSHPYG